MTYEPLPLAIDLLASLLLVAGGGFALVGAIGLVRLRDLYSRLHAPTKASTLGVGGALLASMLVFGWTGQRLVIHELLITVFVFLTAPIAAHLLIKSALELEPLRRPTEPLASGDAADAAARQARSALGDAGTDQRIDPAAPDSARSHSPRM
jgi:multicomponent K+:H+ antiporter subunit G